MAIRFVMKVL